MHLIRYIAYRRRDIDLRCRYMHLRRQIIHMNVSMLAIPNK